MTDKYNMSISLGSVRRGRIIDAVLGQLSDGMWENSRAAEKYWKYADVEGSELKVDTQTSSSGFYYRDEEWVKSFFASRLKKVVQEEVGNNQQGWTRDNMQPSEYISYRNDVTVSECYECYDFLKGRHGHKYAFNSYENTSGIKDYRQYILKFVKMRCEARGFEITARLEDLFSSIISYFERSFEELRNNGFSEDSIATMEADYTEEKYEIAWPSITDAALIIQDALRSDSGYFLNITQKLGYSMTPDDCLKAAYFCDSGLRDAVFLGIREYAAYRAANNS